MAKIQQSAQSARNVKKRKRFKIAAIVSAVVFVCGLMLGIAYIDNRTVEYDYVTIGEAKDAVGYIKIAHLADLHFDNVKVDMQAMSQQLSIENPDLIVITGDLIHDAAASKSRAMLSCLDSLEPIAPVYFVEGNHEVRSCVDKNFYTELTERGMIILRNEHARLSVRGINLNVIGLKDDAEYSAEYSGLPGQDYTVLLAHRPEKFPSYSAASHLIRPNLVLSGHAHGGQFRVLGQGVFSPDQGLFPRYDSGLYQSPDGEVTMMVSRGIGNSLFPFRFHNKPHIPILTVFISKTFPFQ